MESQSLESLSIDSLSMESLSMGSLSEEAPSVDSSSVKSLSIEPPSPLNLPFRFLRPFFYTKLPTELVDMIFESTDNLENWRSISHVFGPSPQHHYQRDGSPPWHDFPFQVEPRLWANASEPSMLSSLTLAEPVGDDHLIGREGYPCMVTLNLECDPVGDAKSVYCIVQIGSDTFKKGKTFLVGTENPYMSIFADDGPRDTKSVPNWPGSGIVRMLRGFDHSSSPKKQRMYWDTPVVWRGEGEDGFLKNLDGCLRVRLWVVDCPDSEVSIKGKVEVFWASERWM